MITYLQSKNSDKLTIEKWLYNFCRFAHHLTKVGIKKDFKDLSREDIEKCVASVNTNPEWAEWTKNTVRSFIKAFYKYRFGEGLYFPKCVAGIKVGRPKNKLLPTDMLEEEDVQKLIDSAKTLRDKVIIALLYDTGIRIGELMSIRKQDVRLDARPSFVAVNGKTGIREVILTFSVPYLAQYLNTYKDIKANELLWNYEAKGEKRPYQYGAIRMMIRRASEAAKLGKRVWNHLFRHSRATFYANRLTDRQMEKLFGWSSGSRQPANYSHLSTNDVNNAVLVANGLRPVESLSAPKLRARTCPRCQSENYSDAMYCARCGQPIDISTAMQVQKDREVFFEKMATALKDPKDFDNFVAGIKRRQKTTEKRRA